MAASAIILAGGSRRSGRWCRSLAADFSRGVLQPRPEGLAVLPVSGIVWNDLGDPARALATQSGLVGALATA